MQDGVDRRARCVDSGADGGLQRVSGHALAGVYGRIPAVPIALTLAEP